MIILYSITSEITDITGGTWQSLYQVAWHCHRRSGFTIQGQGSCPCSQFKCADRLLIDLWLASFGIVDQKLQGLIFHCGVRVRFWRISCLRAGGGEMGWGRGGVGGGRCDLYGPILSEALTCTAKSSPLTERRRRGKKRLVFAVVIRGGFTSTRQLL